MGENNKTETENLRKHLWFLYSFIFSCSKVFLSLTARRAQDISGLTKITDIHLVIAVHIVGICCHSTSDKKDRLSPNTSLVTSGRSFPKSKIIGEILPIQPICQICRISRCISCFKSGNPADMSVNKQKKIAIAMQVRPGRRYIADHQIEQIVWIASKIPCA